MVRLLLPIPAADTISVGCQKLLPFPFFPPSPPLIVILAATNTFLSNHAMSVLAEIIYCQVSMDMELMCECIKTECV